MKHKALAAVAFLLFLMPLAGQDPLSRSWELPEGCDSFAFSLKLAEPGEITVSLEAGDGKQTPFKIRPVSQKLPESESVKAIKGEVSEVPDQGLLFYYVLPQGRRHVNRFVRPYFERYQPDEVAKNIVRWEETLPDALNCVSHLEIRPGPGCMRLYTDGLFMFDLPCTGGLRKVHIKGGAGTVVTDVRTFPEKESAPFFETVDMKYEAHPGVMKDAILSLEPGLHQLEGVPVIVGSGNTGSDLSLVGELRGLVGYSNDYYMQRTSWERHECTQHWSVPSGFYHEACILFALDPDPEKDRAFSFRLGRFSREGRGLTSWAYTDVFFPAAGEPMPENIREVGKVRFNGKEIPLYLGFFPIDIGSIAHIPFNDVNAGVGRLRDHLDLDIMGRRRGGSAAHRPDTTKKSAVNIFGITLRRSGVSLHAEQKEPGNIFFNGEKPETAFKLRAERPGRFTVTWRTLDTTGKTELTGGSEELTFEKAGEEKTVTLDLTQKDSGHYLFEVSVLENGKTLYTHPGSFALLGPDTRHASCLESPFASWHSSAHGGESDPEIYLKIFHKAGIRRISGGYEWLMRRFVPDLLEKYEKYKTTPTQFSFFMPPDKKEDPEKFDRFMHDKYDPLIRDFPNTKYALVFHESYPDDVVPERFGEKGTATEKDRKFTRIATDIAEWFRKNHPDIKLVFGNSLTSSALTAALLRCGFKKEYLDFIGIEKVGAGCIPERTAEGAQGSFAAREAAKTWGVQAKVTGCYEFTTRNARLFENAGMQAAYYMRDALIGLAYGFETVNVSGISQPDNCYSQTVWGNGSFCGTRPLLYPKPVLAAYAALTRALDRIEFHPVSRDTGNCSCYALEFTRKDGGFAYALWVPRGTAEVRFDFPRKIEGTHIGFLGKTSSFSGRTLNLTASEYPQYFIVPVKADTVKHLRTISPEPPKGWKPEAVTDKLADIHFFPAASSSEQKDVGLRPGTFEVREVNDPEKGACLEFELIRKGSVPDIAPEYARFDFKKPIVLSGTPDEIGLWIKGDGGWGQIVFEIQDARGVRFRNEGTYIDYAAKSYINFKGWYFMTYPITGKGLRPRRSPSIGGEWSPEDSFCHLPMVYPLKLLGLHITLRRKTPAPADTVDAPCVIRIRELGGISNPEYQPAK